MKKQQPLYTRRKFMGTAAAGFAAVPFISAQGQEKVMEAETPEKIENAARRNVVFVLSDDHRYDFMSFLNTPKFLETPNMDRMAREGAHLQNAFVTTSLCSPSRASILTGQFSHKHGVVDNQTAIPPNTIFFPQLLQQAGYETAFIGKWHMGEASDRPRKGFDHWVSFRGQGVYYDPQLNVNGQEVKRQGYVTDILTDYAVDFINKKREKPFFLYLSHKAVHAMFEPAKQDLGKYENVKIDYPANMANTEENYKGKPRWVKDQRYSWHGVDYMYNGQMDFDTFYRRYCETLLALDRSIGTVLDTLEKKGIGKSTLVMYMSDNGFLLGEHGMIDKRNMYEESIRIPLLAYCPDLITPGSKIPQLIQNIDIAPTVMEAAGLRKIGKMDGRSFLPLLGGENPPWRDEIYYEYFWERPFPQTPTVFGIRQSKYKYMTYHGIWDLDELYNIEEDPHEMNNLIEHPDMKDTIELLRKKIFDWLEATDGMQIPLERSGLWQSNYTPWEYFEKKKK